MTLGDVIARVQAECPGFAHVDHALTSPSDFSYPAALITPVRYRGQAPHINIPGGYAQDVAMIFGVYIVLKRRQNGAIDNGAADEFDSLLAELRAALVNWAGPGLIAPVAYAGGEMAPYETGNVTWRDDYAADFELRY